MTDPATPRPATEDRPTIRILPAGHATTPAAMRITYHSHLSSTQAAAALAAAAGRGLAPVGQNLTRQQAGQAITALLRGNSTDPTHEPDRGLSNEQRQDTLRWAAGQIRRLWPGLADAALRALLAAHAPPLIQTLADQATGTAPTNHATNTAKPVATNTTRTTPD